MINFYAAEAVEHTNKNKNKNKTLKIHPHCDIQSQTVSVFFAAFVYYETYNFTTVSCLNGLRKYHF